LIRSQTESGGTTQQELEACKRAIQVIKWQKKTCINSEVNVVSL
jgi:hypothetical protein